MLEEHRWKIDRLGRMSVEGPVVGPASTPDPVAAAEQETLAAERDREARREAEWWEDITHAGLSFLRMRGVGM